MKICIISFDYWNYDHHIVKKLQEKGIDASHINMGAYKYKNFGERASNAISKIFLNKNIKHVKRQEYVVNTLKELGPQDQILVLNPHTLDYGTIKEIKSYTPYLISYLYDNLDRFPVEEKLELFDKIYSFEDKDVEKYGFEKITNYNYLSEQPIPAEEIENDLFYITSYDKRRIKLLRKLVSRLSALQVRSKIIVVGKQIWKEKLRNFILRPTGSSLIEFRKKPINNETILEEYKKSKVIIDLMREGQAGLSFRIFEAMALGKKIITDNQSIKTYDFYRPENFLIVNDDLSNIENQFFTLSYQTISTSLYQKYSLNHWVDHIFGISSIVQSKNIISTY
ncbi:hypothetical protein [Sphingobacterium sp.]|uniref:glycosyltransferase family protein n=1 Tax=Sphingobacterium sp. TaxID=341027 RepID=UPI0028AA494A|nr:hypothetical protein [Sphingobacterium sp.]